MQIVEFKLMKSKFFLVTETIYFVGYFVFDIVRNGIILTLTVLFVKEGCYFLFPSFFSCLLGVYLSSISELDTNVSS